LERTTIHNKHVNGLLTDDAFISDVCMLNGIVFVDKGYQMNRYWIL